MSKKEKIAKINKRLRALDRLRDYSEVDRIEALEDRVYELEDDVKSLRIAVSVLQNTQYPTEWDYAEVICERGDRL